jgi:hypothetical protein
MQGNSLHLLNNFLLNMKIPPLLWKKPLILKYHIKLVPKIASKEYGAHIPLKKHHNRARNMFGVKKPKLDFQSIHNFNRVLLIAVVRMNVLDFGVFVQDEFFGLVGTVDGTVVPEGAQPLIMVGVEVGQKVVEGVLWKGF